MATLEVTGRRLHPRDGFPQHVELTEYRRSGVSSSPRRVPQHVERTTAVPGSL
ncbi:hypothetical protein DPMN_109600 [Dreissena polymorpha]|uniref:Uncharacterized protein n=1 Tax=Dreissena polymorpha TaxID=45954 RepID=A0A9D4KB14_DREPO|nr:hypothetical protein DPMN_109600 [Dreissena polymorpha]